jgi:hypothetical protein
MLERYPSDVRHQFLLLRVYRHLMAVVIDPDV